MLDIDLSEFKCPQFFVQFKWHLLQADKAESTIRFHHLGEQDISDIVRYLTQHNYHYYSQVTSQPFIEVSIKHV